VSDPVADLRPGSIVRLRSGGPRMTVLDVGRYTGVVWCRWEAWEPGAGPFEGVARFIGRREEMVPAVALVADAADARRE
jgi:uncharacterized protein YodC (DUF2158 family)